MNTAPTLTNGRWVLPRDYGVGPPVAVTRHGFGFPRTLPPLGTDPRQPLELRAIQYPRERRR